MKNQKTKFILQVVIPIICTLGAIITIYSKCQKNEAKTEFRLEDGQTKTQNGVTAFYTLNEYDEVHLVFSKEVKKQKIIANFSNGPIIEEYSYRGISYMIVLKKQNRSEGTGYFINGEIINMNSG